MGLQAKQLNVFLITLVIGVALGGFLANRFLCNDNVITHTDTLFIYDTVTYQIETPIPVADTIIIHKPYPVEVIKHDSVLLTDTVFIFAEWQKERVYYDTIQDARIRAYLHERVQFNRIVHRDFSYQILAPQAQITQVHNYVHMGLLLYYTGQDAGFAPYVSYANQRFTAGLGYDFIRRGAFLTTGLTLFKW